MSRKSKSRWIALLAACLFAALCSLFVACAPDETTEDPNNPSGGIENPGGEQGGETGEDTFVADIPEDVSIEYGSTYNFDTAAGLYNGEIIDPVITVLFEGTTSVQVLNKKMVLTRLGEYNVTYTFTLPNGENKTYEQTITSVDTKAPSIIQSGEIEGKYRIGDEVTLPTFTASDLVDGDDIAVDVKVYCGEEKEENLVTVQAGKFTVEGYETYTVLAMAEDESGNKAERRVTVNVFAENEIEFFNGQQYVDVSVSTAGGGQMAYNTDKNFVIEGSGSMHYYTTKDGKWISLLMDTVKNLDFTDAYGLSYWVYNNSPRAYNLDFSVDGASVRIVSRDLIQPKRWTKVVIPKEKFEAQKYQGTDLVTFSFNGDDYKDNFWEFDMYIDCVRYEKTAPSLSIAPEDVLCQASDAQTTLLAADDYTAGMDASLIKAHLLDAENNKTELSVVNGEIKHAFTEMGRYTVCYSYIDGTEGVTAAQSVTVYGDLTMPEGYIDDMSKDYTAYLYKGRNSVGEQFSPVWVEGDGTAENPNRIVGASKDQIFGIELPAALFEKVDTGDIVTIRYKMNITAPAEGLAGTTGGGASDFNLRASYGGTKYIGGSGYLDEIEIGVWKDLTFVYNKAFAEEYGMPVVCLEYPWAEGYYLTYGYAVGSVEIASVTYEKALAHEGFEDAAFDAEKYILNATQAATTLSFGTAFGNQSLKLVNSVWDGYAFVTVKLEEDMLAALDENAKIVFYARVNALAHQTAFGLKVGTEKENWNLLSQDNISTGLTRYEIAGADKIALVKEAGQLSFYFPATLSSDFNDFEAYIDDIVVLEA